MIALSFHLYLTLILIHFLVIWKWDIYLPRAKYWELKVLAIHKLTFFPCLTCDLFKFLLYLQLLFHGKTLFSIQTWQTIIDANHSLPRNLGCMMLHVEDGFLWLVCGQSMAYATYSLPVWMPKRAEKKSCEEGGGGGEGRKNLYSSSLCWFSLRPNLIREKASQ